MSQYHNVLFAITTTNNGYCRWFHFGGFLAKIPGTLWGLITGNEETIKEVEGGN